MQNNSAQVRPEGGRRVTRKIEHFNLDVIISVGYRVKSLRGTQFRQWATRRLREHLVSGYTLNRQRLAERGLREARDTLDLLARTFAAIADFRAALIARGEASPLLGLHHDLNPQALTALTLLIAESAPANKDLLVRLIVNLLAGPEA